MHSSISQRPMADGGAGYFLLGFKLIQLKGIRRFVYVPLTINLLLFAFGFYYVFSEIKVFLASLISDLHTQVDSATVLSQWFYELLIVLLLYLKPVVVVFILVCFSFIFSAVANWIAAPFNGLLSEKIENLLTGERISDAGFSEIIKDIPRTLSREWQKFVYYLPRALGFLILSFLIPIVGQIIWFLFIGWMMAIQYKDYPFDNHKIPFNKMRSHLNQNKGLSFSFGITTSIFAMIPLVNLIVMPVAICGATALWIDKYRSIIIK